MKKLLALLLALVMVLSLCACGKMTLEEAVAKANEEISLPFVGYEIVYKGFTPEQNMYNVIYSAQFYDSNDIEDEEIRVISNTAHRINFVNSAEERCSYLYEQCCEYFDEFPDVDIAIAGVDEDGYLKFSMINGYFQYCKEEIKVFQ